MQYQDKTTTEQTEHAFTRQLSKRCLFSLNPPVIKQDSYRNLLSMKHRAPPERRTDSSQSILTMKSPMTRKASRFSAEHYGFGQAAEAAKPVPHFENPVTPVKVADEIMEEVDQEVTDLIKPVTRDSDELDRFFINPIED